MTQVFKIVLSVSMVLSFPTGASAAKPPACGKALYDKCQASALQIAQQHSFTLGQVAVSNSNNLQGGAAGEGQANAAAGAAMDGAAAKCQSDAGQCQSACASVTPEQKKQQDTMACKKALGELAQTFANDAANLKGDAASAMNTANAAGSDPGSSNAPGSSQPQSSGGGGLGGMGGLGAAALGAAAGGLLGYMMGKKSGEDKNQNNDGALQANGTIDCSKKDASNYSDCNSYLSAVCSQKMTSNAFSSDSTCQKFSQRYCGSSGEGLTNDPIFCQNVLAHNFCKQTGRSECPSCLQIAANQAPACVNNPALCLAQNSAEQIEAAKSSCPTDPIFANPANIKTGNQIVTELNPGVSLPVVTLPSGTAASSTTTAATTTAGTSTPTGSGTVVTMSAQSVRKVASSGGGANAVAGPASDVQGQYGPSVFALSTQALKQRCQTGKLNCP